MGVEELADGAYRRSLRLPHGQGKVELRPGEGHVQARFWLADLRDLPAAMQRSRGLLDLDSDPEAVVEALGADPLLGPLVRAAPGSRVPGHVDAHELAVRAVLGQQVSVTGGPWTASYVAMRALRDPDAFLPTDLGVRHALERLGEDGRPVAAQRLAMRWRPYRAYALQHLWASLAAPAAAEALAA